jgi:CDP-diglyceride synthetase
MARRARSGGDDGAPTPVDPGPSGPAAANGSAGRPGSEPGGAIGPDVISVGPADGAAVLPHWTEPPSPIAPAPTGDAADRVDQAAPDPDATAAPNAALPARSSPASEGSPDAPEPDEVPSQPDHRASPPAQGAAGWTDTTFADLAGDGDTRLGALDERDRPLDEQYLTFEDLDVPQADLPTVPPRGSADDPIFIQRTGGRPPHTEPVGSDAGDSGETGSAAEPPERSGTAHAEGVDGSEHGSSDAAGGEDPDPGDASDDGATDPPAVASSGRDRNQAIAVGLGISAAVLAVFLVGALTPLRWLPVLLVVAAVVGAMVELFNAAVRAGFRPLTFIGLSAGIAMPVVAYFAGTPTIPNGESGMVLVLAVTLAACMAWYLFGAGRGRPVPNIAITMLGVVYVGMLGSYGALILRAGPWPASGTAAEQGIPLIILVIVGTEIYNAGGYLLGSRLGRTPLSAASPSKTREGLVLGIACAVASIVLIGGVLEIGVRTMQEALILAAVVAVVAPLGDLFESMLKRDLGVKDMSTLIPSHGGLLDRVDALLFTLPASYYTLRVLGLL